VQLIGGTYFEQARGAIMRAAAGLSFNQSMVTGDRQDCHSEDWLDVGS